MSGEWIRADLPSLTDVLGGFSPEEREQGAIEYLGAALDHLNANHPKSDTDRWRRAHEIVERERDQARDQWKKWEHKANEAEREVSTWRTSTESAHSDFLQAAHDRDEAVARAEAAEARTIPAVSRADVAETLSRCLSPKMWNVTFPSVVSEVCDLFGVEAEQAADPVEEKARELYRAATPDARWETVADEYRRIAAHVLGPEDNLNAEFETTREHTTDTRYVHLPCPHCGWHP